MVILGSIKFSLPGYVLIPLLAGNRLRRLLLFSNKHNALHQPVINMAPRLEEEGKNAAFILPETEQNSSNFIVSRIFYLNKCLNRDLIER